MFDINTAKTTTLRGRANRMAYKSESEFFEIMCVFSRQKTCIGTYITYNGMVYKRKTIHRERPRLHFFV